MNEGGQSKMSVNWNTSWKVYEKTLQAFVELVDYSSYTIDHVLAKQNELYFKLYSPYCRKSKKFCNRMKIKKIMKQEFVIKCKLYNYAISIQFAKQWFIPGKKCVFLVQFELPGCTN